VLCWLLGLGCLGFPPEQPGWGARRAHVPVSPSGKPHPRDTAPERETLPGEGKQARRRGRRWPPQLCSQSGDFIHCPPVGVSSSLEHFGAPGFFFRFLPFHSIKKSRMHEIINKIYLQIFLEMCVIFHDKSNNNN